MKIFQEPSKYSSIEREYLDQFLNSQKPDLGWVAEFESRFAKITDRKYAIAVNSATGGLHAALFASNVQPGDEVISPALTVIMDSYVTVFQGATPVYADLEKESHNIDYEDVARKISSKTKAIMGVSWQGLPCNINKLLEIAKDKDIVVIDDSAQTLFANPSMNSQNGVADISVYSFEEKKHITTGSEGGMVVTDDEELAVKIRKFAGIGYKHLTASAGRTSLAKATSQRPTYIRFDTMGLNYRMNEVSACIGLGQLDRLESILSNRIKNANVFLEVLREYPNIFQLQDEACLNHSYYTVGAVYNGQPSWESFYNLYVSKGAEPFYAAVANPYLEGSMDDLAKIHGWANGMCPNAEHIQNNLMAFKTNYRNHEQCLHDSILLKETIEQLCL
jgi:perosamine synthetase